MELDALVAGRIDGWFEKRAGRDRKSAYQADEALANVHCLCNSHSLNQ